MHNISYKIQICAIHGIGVGFLSCKLIARRAGEGEEEAGEGEKEAGENELQRRKLGGAEMENRKFR